MLDKNLLANPQMWLDPKNDGRHALRDAPAMRESIPYVISLPEHGLAAFVYTWVDRQSVAGYATAIFGPALPDGPIVGRVNDVQMAAGDNFDDWLIGDFYLSQDLEMHHARVEWKTNAASLEFDFEATHPAYGFANDPRGCWEFFADDRLEQGGRAKGTITVGEKTYPFDATAHRDHSWGARDWHIAHHWKWLVAQSGSDIALHVFQMFVRGKIELRGFVFKDGKQAEVTDFSCDFELDDHLNQKSLNGTITDNLGRETVFTSTCFAVQPLHPEPANCLNEGALDMVIDGKPSLGWVEFKWPQADIDHAVQLAKEGRPYRV
ncbi:MAG: hypothetical protein AB7U34_06890 [Novosphingobium sp.]